MKTKLKTPLNVAALSKKYKCDINKLIRYWKNDKSDYEISRNLGLDMLKLMQIRQEITYICEKERQQRIKRKFPPKIIHANTNKPR